MTIHFFTKGDYRLSDSRHRAIKIAEELRARGFDCVVHTPPVIFISDTPWPDKFFLVLKVIRNLFSVHKGDIVFLQRAIGNKYFFLIMVIYLKLFRRKMIFDYDDAIYLHDYFKTKMLTKMAAAVFVCGEDLAKWARQYNSNVHIFHTTVKLADYELFTKDYRSEPHTIVIGWVGTAKDHYNNLAILSEAFKRLVKKTRNPFKFRLVGVWGYPKIKELFESIADLEMEFIEYLEPSRMPEMIQSFDIGVNPLAEKNEWMMARSSFKPYEYMACGVVTITSAVSEIVNVIKDGENGLVADGIDEWVEKLEQLIDNHSLRERLGKAGQQTMRFHESYEAIMPRLVSVIHDITTR